MKPAFLCIIMFASLALQATAADTRPNLLLVIADDCTPLYKDQPSCSVVVRELHSQDRCMA